MQKRNTKQRELVLEAVRNRRDHPTADEIFADVRERDGKISRGTVYRNLSVLSELGEIEHVKVPSADRFDLRLDRHYHMVCLRCGKVTDAPIPYRRGCDEEAEDATGFRIERHRTIFEGVCPECLKEEAAGRE